MILFKKIYFLVLVLVVVSACEKEIDYKGDNLESFLVLNAALQTDSIVTCRVSKSRTLLDNKPIQTISDASVELYINDELAGELVAFPNGEYRSESTVVKSGMKYELRVKYASFKAIKAVSLVPGQAKAEVESFKMVEVRTDEYTSEKLRLKVKVSDMPGNDYYRLKLYAPQWWYNEETGEYEFDEDSYYSLRFDSSDPVLNGNVVVVNDDFSDHPLNEYRVFDDALFEGEDYVLTFDVDGYDLETASKMKIDLQKISYDLYLYYKTLDAYNYYEDSPFSEPVRIHSNVSNGAGVVGSFTSNWLTIE